VELYHPPQWPALKIVSYCLTAPKQIGRFPRSGRMVPEYEQEDLREVIEAPSRIIYRILPERIDVLAVIHGSQEKPRLR
jgi:toxin ParE1/3/4